MKLKQPVILSRLPAFILMAAFIFFTTTVGAQMNKYPATDFFDPPMVKLLHSLQQGDEFSAKQQLAQGLSLNITGKQGITPLFWFFLNEDKAAAKLALKIGADPNFPDAKGRTPVYIFAVSDRTDWLKIILDAGVNPNTRTSDGEPVLFSAIGGNKPMENTKLMVAYGADVNLKNNSDENSLQYAVLGDVYNVAVWLAENGADICSVKNNDFDVASTVKMDMGTNKELGRPDSPDLLKLKALLEQRGAWQPGPQSRCH